MLHFAFAQTIIQELQDQIPPNIQVEWHYTSSWFNFDLLTVNKPNCILVHRDIICSEEFNHARQTITTGAQRYLNLVNRHPDTNFILMHGSQCVERELVHERLTLVRAYSGLAMQKDEYQQLVPSTNKNFNSNKTFICLNRHPRQHRINLVSYLLGLNLEQFGTISFRDTDFQNVTFMNRTSWPFSDQQIETIKPILFQGYNKIRNLNLDALIEKVDQIYNKQPGNIDNVTNFDLNLRNVYQDHFVEIVSETLFNTPTVGVSEKFLNSVYGYVFPIVIGAPGVIQVLSNFGFDMFEDVIDQSYDNISDPFDRLCAAIDLNKHLLTDHKKIKQLWTANQDRFNNNVTFAKTKLYNVVKNRAHNDFDQIKWKL